MKTIILMILTLLFFGCNLAEPDDDVFYIRNDGLDMPVWVRGNKDSQTFIILMAGYPGSGIAYPSYEGFKKLEEDNRVVYWDIRGSGSSKGNTSATNYTVKLVADDTNLLIDAINDKYNNPTLFLMGHSFGGCTALTFLLNDDYQKKVKGWINLEGAVNDPTLMNMFRDKVITYANDHQDDYYWKNALTFCNENSTFSNKTMAKYIEYSEKSGIREKNETGYDAAIQSTFTTPFGSLEFITSFYFIESNLKFPYEYANYIPLEELKYITLPVIIMHGRFSKGGMGEELAKVQYDALGTTTDFKEYVIFENSGHMPHITEPDLMTKNINDFIGKYR